jgi:hypothetical protein
MLNVFSAASSVIPAVNPRITAQYYASAPQSVAPGGKQIPNYITYFDVQAQVQPVSTDDIRKYDFLQMQGIYRSVYLYGKLNAIDRGAAQGGDLLNFPEIQGGPQRTWLVKQVAEVYEGWCRVIVVLQLDPLNTL